jgi:NTF2 fold immunity protein
MKIIIIIFTVLIISCNSKNERNEKCTQAILIKLAENEWLKVYGKGIYSNKPFVVNKKNDSTWVVEGTLQEGFLGGVPKAEISMKTCKLISISHGK